MEKYFLSKKKGEFETLKKRSKLFFDYFKIEFNPKYQEKIIFYSNENETIITPSKNSKIERIVQIGFPKKEFPFIEGILKTGIFDEGLSKKYVIYQKPIELTDEP